MITIIVNGYTTTYAIFSFLSLSTGVGAASIGGWTAKAWKKGMSAEKHHALQRWVYLIITLANLGLFLRLFMVPLWFVTLHSLIPSLPGAMCLTGVHLANSPVSFIATGFKLMFPLLYIAWLIMDAVDRKVEAQPLMKAKLIAIVPIGALVVAESCFDLQYLVPLHPLKVTCCTSLFDAPKYVSQNVAGNTASWTVVFYICFLALILAMTLHARGKWTKGILPFMVIGSSASFVTFFLALHEHLSPLLLNAPFHHCVFCLWQDNFFAVLFTVLIVIGLWFAIIYAAVSGTGVRRIKEGKGLLRKLLKTSITCSASGLVILTVCILFSF